MRVGGSLGSEGTLSRVLRVLTCSRVSGYFDAQEYHDRASDRMRWYRSAELVNICILQIIRAFYT